MTIDDVIFENYRNVCSNTQFLTVLHIARYEGKNCLCGVSLGTLAHCLGVTERAVQLNLRRLERSGLIVRVDEPGKASQFDIRPFFSAVRAHAWVQGEIE